MTNEKLPTNNGINSEKVILTCALTGVFTDPKTHGVPVTAKEMADAAAEAFNAGATIVHCHFRNQEEGKGHLPTWKPEVVGEICRTIRQRVPEIIINCSTGILGEDISEPLECLKTVKPEIAALNSGSLNYLKTRKDGSWAWPPILFDNPVEKVKKFLDFMRENSIVPECECFDTGILRSVRMYRKNGMFKHPPFVSLVMGVASGMPSNPAWLPLLVNEMDDDYTWQVIAIGRQEVWPLLRRAIELGGNIRTGLEDTFYLPDGSKTFSNGKLVEAAVKLVESAGKTVANTEETRRIYSLQN